MGSPVGPDTPQDPVRATLLEILRQLNQAESVHEGTKSEQSLELGELEDRLGDFWGVNRGQVKVSLAVGLLLRNGLVTVLAPGEYSWQRQRNTGHRYGITAEGKRFLVGSIQTSDRIV